MASDASRAFEAVVLVADDPVDPQLLAQLLEVSTARIDELFAELSAEYEREGRGFVLAKVAGGYRFQSHHNLTAYVERFVLEGQSARLSSAALETLAIIAYKQPISRAQVAQVRGVNVDGVVRTLEQRGYIGFGDAIEVEHVTTPLDWAARGMERGAPFAAAHSFSQTGPFRPSNIWGENVVFTGSGTQPGVGVPMVLVSGRLAAERITGPDPSYRPTYTR